jgi:Tol biopolymer transport system component
LRLTTNPASDLNPVWSPDGRYIAFTREGEGSGVYLVPALGGAERKLAEIFPQRPIHWLSLSYSPDGRYLAVADKTAAAEPYGIFLLEVETGVRRRLTSPPAGSVGDQSPAFSPDGKSLAFGRQLAYGTKDIYIVPVAGGEPRRITFDKTQTFGLTWTAAGNEIVFSSLRNGDINLWRVPVAGGVPTRVEVSAQRLYHPVISRQGNRLAATQILVTNSDIWRVQIPSLTRQNAAPAKFIASTTMEYAPQYSPDGQRIAFNSFRSGSREIWVCDREGRNPIPLTSMGVPYTTDPNWSPDGREMAFACLLEGNRDIYVISVIGRKLRRLTTEPAEELRPSWSRDGRWIYFGSSRSGSMQIWKAPASSGPAVQVTRHGGFGGFESSDGKYLYYTKDRVAHGIWRIAVTGGEETLVLDQHTAGGWDSWAVAEQGIYFANTSKPAHPLIEFFSFATGKVTLVAAIGRGIGSGVTGLAVSPDNRWLLYPQFDSGGSDIMLIEKFR